MREYGKYFGTEGLEDVKIPDANVLLRGLSSESRESTVQVVDARFVAGWRHLLFATLGAIHAFEVGSNISQTLAIEILLYISGQRQIHRAIELVGVNDTSTSVGLVVVSASKQMTRKILDSAHEMIGGKLNPLALEVSSANKEKLIKERFGISDEETRSKIGVKTSDALTELMIERGALLPARA